MVAVFAQHVRAEGVDRADMGTETERLLPPQAQIVRALRRGAGERLHNAPTQLRRRRARIGDDEEAVDVNRVRGIRHIADEPLREHTGLAAAGGGGHEQAAAAVFDRGALVGCKLKRHGPDLAGLHRFYVAHTVLRFVEVARRRVIAEAAGVFRLAAEPRVGRHGAAAQLPREGAERGVDMPPQRAEALGGRQRVAGIGPVLEADGQVLQLAVLHRV